MNYVEDREENRINMLLAMLKDCDEARIKRNSENPLLQMINHNVDEIFAIKELKLKLLFYSKDQSHRQELLSTVYERERLSIENSIVTGPICYLTY